MIGRPLLGLDGSEDIGYVEDVADGEDGENEEKEICEKGSSRSDLFSLSTTQSIEAARRTAQLLLSKALSARVTCSKDRPGFGYCLFILLYVN